MIASHLRYALVTPVCNSLGIRMPQAKRIEEGFLNTKVPCNGEDRNHPDAAPLNSIFTL